MFRRRRNLIILPSDLTLAGSEFYTVGAATEKTQSQLLFSPEECKEGYYWLNVAVWNFLLELASNLDKCCVDESA